MFRELLKSSVVWISYAFLELPYAAPQSSAVLMSSSHGCLLVGDMCQDLQPSVAPVVIADYSKLLNDSRGFDGATELQTSEPSEALRSCEYYEVSFLDRAAHLWGAWPGSMGRIFWSPWFCGLRIRLP